jgi:hypothetical protein
VIVEVPRKDAGQVAEAGFFRFERYFLFPAGSASVTLIAARHYWIVNGGK